MNNVKTWWVQEPGLDNCCGTLTASSWIKSNSYLYPAAVSGSPEAFNGESEHHGFIRSHGLTTLYTYLSSSVLFVQYLFSFSFLPLCWNSLPSSAGNFTCCSRATLPPLFTLPHFNNLFPLLLHSLVPLLAVSLSYHLFFLYLILSPWLANGAWDWLINSCLLALQRQLGNLVRVYEIEEEMRSGGREGWIMYSW